MPSRGLLLTVWPALVLAAGCTLPVSNRGVTAGPDDGAAGGRIAFPINAGSIGGTAHIILPDEDELAPGFGTGVAWEAIWIVQGRIEAAIWSVRADESGDTGGVVELSAGGGFYMITVGAGAIIPLWDEGALELKPAALGYAGISVPPIPLGGGGSALTIQAVHRWYTSGAEVSGRDVDLDDWRISLALHLAF